ncbi:MAG: ABC transporter permease [Bacteroidales bacterium]|nr:ABC transporter permease [Bacteroidales bacterium]
MKKGFFAIVKRELQRMISRPIYLVMTIIIPSIVIIFFATFFNQGVPEQMPIAVIDFDNSSTSRMIVRSLNAGQMCKIKYKLTSYESAKTNMQRGEIYAFVIIPRNFEKDVYNGKQPVINFHTEYAHYLGSSLIMKEIQTTLTTISIGADLKVRLQKGENQYYAMAQVNPIANDSHIIANSKLNYAFYLSSIMMPGIICLMALMCSVYVIGIELKDGTSRRWLVAGNKNIVESLTGKLLPYTVLFWIMIIMSEIVMEKFMGFPNEGNPAIMYLGALFTVISYQAVGIFLIGLLPSMRTALSIAAFYGTMGFTLSGFTYPNAAMLDAVKPYTYLYPLRQYYEIYCNVQINGLSFSHTLVPFIILMLFWLVFPFSTVKHLRYAAVKLNYKRD